MKNKINYLIISLALTSCGLNYDNGLLIILPNEYKGVFYIIEDKKNADIHNQKAYEKHGNLEYDLGNDDTLLLPNIKFIENWEKVNFSYEWIEYVPKEYFKKEKINDKKYKITVTQNRVMNQSKQEKFEFLIHLSDKHLDCNNFNKIVEYIKDIHKIDNSDLIWGYIMPYYILITGDSVDKSILIKPVNSEEQFYRVTCENIDNCECTIEKIKNYNTENESYQKILPNDGTKQSNSNVLQVLDDWFSEIITHIDKTYPMFKKGQELAKQDIQQNSMKYKLYGQPRMHDQRFKKLLLHKYNIELDIVAGCLVTDEITYTTDGYNKIIREYTFKKYGKDIFKETEERVYKQGYVTDTIAYLDTYGGSAESGAHWKMDTFF